MYTLMSRACHGAICLCMNVVSEGIVELVVKVTITAGCQLKLITESGSVVIIITDNSVIICSGLSMLHAFQVQNQLANQWIFKASKDRARPQVRKAYRC